MSDKRSAAIILGTALGIAAAAAVIGLYISQREQPRIQDVNEILTQARQTVQDLDKAVEALRKSPSA